MTEFRMDREKDVNHRISSWKALALVVVLVATWEVLVEVLVMVEMESGHVDNLVLRAALDAGLSSIVLSIAAYFLIVRPLVRRSKGVSR